VSSLSSVEDDRVVIQEGGSSRALVHATSHGRTIEGQVAEGGEHVEVDVTRARVLARRLNGPATGAIIGATVVGVAGTVFAVAVIIILASVQTIEAGGPPR
jgi:hypothetical protein